MKLTELDRIGCRVLSPVDKKIGGFRVRPDGVVPRWGEHLLELTDADVPRKKECPKCGRQNVTLTSKGFGRIREIYDLVDDRPMKIVLYPHRWKCNKCKKTFEVDFFGLTKYSIDYNMRLVQIFLEDWNLTYKEMEKQYGISSSHVKRQVTEFLNLRRERIRSVCECDKIVLYPFKYNGFERCCVIGRKLPTMENDGSDDAEEKNTVLLSILPDYNVKTITLFLLEKACYFSDAEVIFCDPNISVYDALNEMHGEADVAVILDRILQIFDDLLPFGRTMQEKLMPYRRQLEEMIDRAQKEGLDLGDELQMWWARFPQKIRTPYLQLWDKVSHCRKGCSAHYSYGYEQTEKVLSIIESFRVRGTSFEIMCDRMMFTLKAVHDQFFSGEKLQEMLCMIPDMYLEGYYVDIPTLAMMFGNRSEEDNGQKRYMVMNGGRSAEVNEESDILAESSETLAETGEENNPAITYEKRNHSCGIITNEDFYYMDSQ